MKPNKSNKIQKRKGAYPTLLKGISNLLEDARRSVARSTNAILTATYWEVGRRIVKFEQGGLKKASYGEMLIIRLAKDLTGKFGRGFGRTNLFQIRSFYLAYPKIVQTASGLLDPQKRSYKSQTLSSKFDLSTFEELAQYFKLSWSHYVKLLSVEDSDTRTFYEKEALRCGWSVRQLDRQISTQFYERTLLSKNKKAMLQKGEIPKTGDLLTPDEEIKDPYILEFLNLKDEYSETELEEALIHHLEHFLLELGGDFAFVGRQKRLRIGDEWYRVDLVFFHRRLRCLIIFELKTGKFSHADIGQMHLYLNYAKDQWMNKGENPPVGIILCSGKDKALVKYALEGLPNKVAISEYKTALPPIKKLKQEIEKTRRILEHRRSLQRK